MRADSGRTTRRSLLGATAALALGVACRAQLGVPRYRRRIAYLSTGGALGPDADVFVAFREGMRSEGFTEGTHYDVTYRFAASDPALLMRFANELVASGAEVIVATSTGATQYARVATRDIPIVMVASHDPVEGGVVASMGRPGGNVTGQSLAGGVLMPLQLDLLQQIRPVRRVGYLSPFFPSPGRGYPSVTDNFELSFRKAAVAAGIDVVAPKIRDMSEIASALASLESAFVDALFLIESPTWFVQLQLRPINEVVDFAVRHRLPSMGGQRRYAGEGLLATYGDARTTVEEHRTVTRYVAEILRGTAPGDLSVDVPSWFELVLNAKTAAAMSLNIPKPVIDRAAYVFS